MTDAGAISIPRVITPGDELYSHQLVAPRLVPVHEHPLWVERCFHILFADDGLMFETGRAVYPYGGRHKAFGTVSTAETQHAVRAVDAFDMLDDPDAPQVGPVRIEVVRPLEEVRLVLDAADRGVAYDLTFTARGAAIPTDRNRIELEGELVTDYMNFYQSGWYSGTIAVDGVETRISDRAGFRDRGWGFRRHEGAPRRGLVLFCPLEFPDFTLYLLLYETASGRRVFTNGWTVDETGVVDTVVAVEHDLELDGPLLVRARLDLTFASGDRKVLTAETRARTLLAAVGYSAAPTAWAPGYDRIAIDDPATVQRLDGMIDNGCVLDLDGLAGYGVIETGIGVHARYRPTPDTTKEARHG